MTVRFGETLWQLIEDESNIDAVSAAQWVRDAALMRALWERSRRGLPTGLATLESAFAESRHEQLPDG